MCIVKPRHMLNQSFRSQFFKNTRSVYGQWTIMYGHKNDIYLSFVWFGFYMKYVLQHVQFKLYNSVNIYFFLPFFLCANRLLWKARIRNKDWVDPRVNHNLYTSIHFCLYFFTSALPGNMYLNEWRIYQLLDFLSVYICF